MLTSELEQGGTTWKPAIVYGYVVNGTSYLSSRVQFMNVVSGSSTFRDSLAKNISEEYPVGKTVTVYYDPDNPEDAVLEPGVGFAIIVCLVIGTFVYCCRNIVSFRHSIVDKEFLWTIFVNPVVG